MNTARTRMVKMIPKKDKLIATSRVKSEVNLRNWSAECLVLIRKCS